MIDHSPQPPNDHRGVRREVAVVFGLSVLLTVGVVSLGYAIPLIGDNALGLVALIFVYLPIVFLRRKGQEPSDYGLRLSGAGRGARWGLAATFATLLPFLLGFHLWETRVYDNALDVRLDNYRTWPDLLRIEPVTSEDGFYFWRYQRNLVARWLGDGPWTVELATDGELVRLSGPPPHFAGAAGDAVASHWEVTTGDGGYDLVFWARGGSWLELMVWRGGEPLPESQLTARGSDPGARPGSLRFERGLMWIPLGILLQLLLVALPEEFFYRGYLQGRLNTLDSRRFKLGPFHTSVPILITSACFALGHFAIGLDVRRLAVFFPSLAFGWLRDRTGGLGAPIVYHAACNLMVELTVVHYWPSG